MITIYNPTPGEMTFYIRTEAGGKWHKFTVGAQSYYYVYDTEPVSFVISFDRSYKPGWQDKQYDLPHATMPSLPTSAGGREYAFETDGDNIDLKIFSGEFSRLVEWERQKVEERYWAKQQEEFAKQEQARRREEERLRPMREAVARGRQAFAEGKYELAIREFKIAMRTVPYDPEIPDLIKQADQELRRDKGCNETHAKALAFFNRKDWGNALRYWQEAKAYCKAPSVIDGWIKLAQAEQEKDSQMIALNAAGNEMFGNDDYIGAYHKYKESLSLRDNPIVKANLQNAQTQCNDRMQKANNNGNSLIAQDRYFDAFVAYWTALKYALDSEVSRKVIKGNLKRAAEGMTPDEAERLEQLGPEGVEQMYAVLQSIAAPVGASANGNPPPARSSLTGKDIDRIKRTIKQRFPDADGIDWDSRKDKQ